jgi:hypothetical protein
METMIAYCGLTCDSCPIHLATLEQDKSRQLTIRESIAEQCSKLYGMNLQLEDITDCDGCRANTGRLFSGCSNCEIRKCAVQKNIENCAYCNDYACERLKEHFSHDSIAQNRLEEIRHANKI